MHDRRAKPALRKCDASHGHNGLGKPAGKDPPRAKLPPKRKRPGVLDAHRGVLHSGRERPSGRREGSLWFQGGQVLAPGVYGIRWLVLRYVVAAPWLTTRPGPGRPAALLTAAPGTGPTQRAVARSGS